MQLYHNPRDAEQMQNLTRFRGAIDYYQGIIDFYQPSPDAAPWHVQADINGTLYNFWPHKAKAQEECCKAVQGWRNVFNLIERARRTHSEPFDVLEG